jgi:predicted regulator of Ras-like GTPase activity (Roadblock/LC7/MglB family)
MNQLPVPHHDPFREALEEFVQKTGAHRAVLLRYDGMLLAEVGFGERDELVSAAALAAGMFASAAQLGELLGDADVARIDAPGTRRRMTAQGFEAGGTMLVLAFSVDADRDEEAVSGALGEFSSVVRGVSDIFDATVKDGDRFEEELLDKVDDLFPGE